MHEFILETGKYKIYYYCKYMHKKNITVDKCFELRSENTNVSLRHFRRSENLFFPKYKIDYGDNILSLIVVEEDKNINMTRVLKKVLPTVFDEKYIKRTNLQYFIFFNRRIIYELSKNILSEKILTKINFNHQLNPNIFLDQNKKDDVEIIEDDVIFF